jgi:hypothetical protein
MKSCCLKEIWMEFECMMLSEKSQTYKDKCHIFSLIYRVLKNKDIEVEGQLLGNSKKTSGSGKEG